MRYQVREKVLAFGDDFTIQDDAGRDVFQVGGKACSLGKKLSLQDMAGQELVFIEQKVLSWGPTFHIHRDGALAATIKKELFSLFKPKFDVDVPGPNDYTVQGNIWSHEYQFTRPQNGVVAQVSKKWFSWSDTYGVDIVPGEDDVLVLATAIVIDQVCHEGRD